MTIALTRNRHWCLMLFQTSTIDQVDTRRQRGPRVPVPSHFVVVVDVSGSMSERDCQPAPGHQPNIRYEVAVHTPTGGK